MKKIYLLLLINTCINYSQVPQSISYQSIAYSSSNLPIANTDIGIKISILDITSTGTILYSERHNKRTNIQGLYSLNIGQGIILSGNFSTIPWGTENKFLKVELDPNGGTNYIATGTTQFMSVPYALNSGSTINGIKTIKNIENLRLTTGIIEGEVAFVKDYIGNNDGGGGHFTWRINGYSNATDNGGTIITPTITNPSNGRWIRNMEDTSINVKWFGILGDINVADYSVQLNKLIETFKTEAEMNRGVKVVFPKGFYRLKNIPVYTGFKFSAEQTARNNWSVNVPVMIYPALGATSVFNFSTESRNACLENLYINGDYTNVPGLEAAVNFNGEFNSLINNNIFNCSKHAVYGSPGVSRIENNNLHGLKSATGYGSNSSVNRGFIGALHLNKFVDGWIINNEIGGTSEYNVFKSPNKKGVAVFIKELSASVVNGNIFENGDSAAYFMDGGFNYFSGNRYELSAGNGLELFNIYQSIFIGERFTNNGLESDGKYDDFIINDNCSGNNFNSFMFSKTYNPALEYVNGNTTKSRYNITNYAQNSGLWLNTFISPYFSHISTKNPNTDHPSNPSYPLTPYCINPSTTPPKIIN